MLKNAYLLAKIGADTAENERNFAEIFPKIGNYPTGPLPSTRGPRRPPRRPRGWRTSWRPRSPASAAAAARASLVHHPKCWNESFELWTSSDWNSQRTSLQNSEHVSRAEVCRISAEFWIFGQIQQNFMNFCNPLISVELRGNRWTFQLHIEDGHAAK